MRQPLQMADRRITGFHLDEAQDWVAELECGHDQHVRHHPPWINRPWVTTPEGRASRLGAALTCTKCDQAAPRDRADPPSDPAVQPDDEGS